MIHKLKGVVRKMLPGKAVRLFKLIILLPKFISNYAYDLKRYLKYSFTVNYSDSLACFEAYLFKYTHVIEKGMTLKTVRLGYGSEKIAHLLRLIDEYIGLGYPPEKKCLINAIAVLYQYVIYHEKRNHPAPDLKTRINKYIADLGLDMESMEGAGTHQFTADHIAECVKQPYDLFLSSRYSLRNYRAESVETQLVIEAIKMAQKAPSACNRQPGKVYIIEDQRIKDEITEMHPGNNGFGEFADKYLVITGALSCYGGIEERNQVYIDGSLFAMTLIEALHFKGIGSCALHWGGVPRADEELRKLVKILPAESILMLVAIGKYPAEFLVAKSCKKNPEDLYCVI